MKKLIYTTAIMALLGVSIAQAVPTDSSTPQQAPEVKKSLEQAREDARQKSIDALKEQFNAMDTNKDGKVSKEEFVQFRIQDYTKKQEDIFVQLDQKNNGEITVEEYQAAVEKMMNDLSNKIAEAMKKRSVSK